MEYSTQLFFPFKWQEMQQHRHIFYPTYRVILQPWPLRTPKAWQQGKSYLTFLLHILNKELNGDAESLFRQRDYTACNNERILQYTGTTKQISQANYIVSRPLRSKCKGELNIGANFCRGEPKLMESFSHFSPLPEGDQGPWATVYVTPLEPSLNQ